MLVNNNVSITEIPKGYKLTEVGVIPEDWNVESLQNLCRSSITYGIVQCGPHIPNGIPYIRVSDMNSSELNVNEMLRTSPEIASSFMRSKVEEGDIVYALRGKLGEVKMVGTPVAGANLTQGTARIAPKNNIDNRYLLWTLRSPQSLKQAVKEAKGSTFVEITLGNLKGITVPLPSSKEEQEKIATALADTDALISELEKLIEKKQAIKTATMQQLLTGKTRLPEFALHKDGTPKAYKDSELGKIPEDWDAFEINEVIENIIDYRGRTPRKLGMDWGGGNIVALSAGNVKKGYIDFDAECYLGSELLYKKWMRNGEAQKDDIAFTMEAPLGNVALIPDHSKYILSQRTILLQVNKQEFDPHFIFHVLMSNEFEKYISDQATGSTAQGIKRSLFEKLKLVLPIELSEQKSISKILDDFNFEIENLNQKLKKLKLIKQGMMQELLTGKTRLV